MPSVPLALHHSRQALVLAATIALAGCGNLNSIHRTLDTNSGKGVLIDAKQRAIIVGERKDKDGDQSGRLRHVACAEPSPDALSAYAAQFAGELGLSPIGGADGTNRSLAIKSALQEAAASIGMRTPSIQLLRDAMYRVCEAYANGAVDDDQYELLMRRYQRQIVAMMAIEQLTQVNRVAPIGLGTGGSIGGARPLSEWTDEISRQQGLLAKQQSAAQDAQKAEEDADTVLKQSPDDKAAMKKKDDAIKAQAAAKAAMAQINSTIASLQDHMAGGVSLMGRGTVEFSSATSAATAKHMEKVAPFVLKIASHVLNVDDTPALCFSYYKAIKNNSSNALGKMCDAQMQFMTAVRVQRAEALNTCGAEKSIEKRSRCIDLFAGELQTGATTMSTNAAMSSRMLKKEYKVPEGFIDGLLPSEKNQPTGEPKKHE